jgi:hypothetical protein
VRNGWVVPHLRSQLDGVGRPVAGGISLYHEVKCEPTQCALLSQPLTYGDRRFADQS